MTSPRSTPASKDLVGALYDLLTDLSSVVPTNYVRPENTCNPVAVFQNDLFSGPINANPKGITKEGGAVYQQVVGFSLAVNYFGGHYTNLLVASSGTTDSSW
jgi:hypothetical protein